ncbi:MAG: DUF2851 family protein [Candidatus Cloacimonetes bacterium]|nr:DUF2851 family protein [Candidatus Cloacimonadota bacterium]
MEEKFLHHIWDANHLCSQLKTVSGKELKVVYQGQYNTFRGPDFVNAIINLDGEDIQGSVEIHQNTHDWQRHSHHEDHFYNKVILHVVLNHMGKDKLTIKEDGEFVEILELKDQLSSDIQKLIIEIGDAHINSKTDYCDLLSAIDNARLFTILSVHGKQRFMGKVKRFNASLSLSSFNQILYEGLMEAAGYDKNKFNLQQLAQSITYANLCAWINEGMSAVQMIGIICGSSGLLTKCQKMILPQQLTAIMEAYEEQRFYARKLFIDWQLFRIRPANQPLNRIILLSEFIFSSARPGLLNDFLQNVESSLPDPKARFKLFSGLFKAQPNSMLPLSKGLGPSVIDNMYLNIYLPIMYLYAQKHADTALAVAIMESWNCFGALVENHVTRFMCRHINPSQIKEVNKKSLYQQGLMDIFYRHCRYHLCEECKQSG